MLTAPRFIAEHNYYEVRDSVSDADTGRLVAAFGMHGRIFNCVQAWVWYWRNRRRYA